MSWGNLNFHTSPLLEAFSEEFKTVKKWLSKIQQIVKGSTSPSPTSFLGPCFLLLEK